MNSGLPLHDLKVKTGNRQILSIALPITLAVLIPQINMLTNSIFLGNLSTESLANAGITGVYYLIFAVAGNGLNNALQTVFSKYAGRGETDQFKTILTQGIRISIKAALFCILFTYLVTPYILQSVADAASFPKEMSFIKIRMLGLPFLFLFQMGNAFLVATLNSRYLLLGFITEAGINILFDYLLIFGKMGFPEMGFNGAAVASVLAEFSGMVVVFGVLVLTGLKNRYGLMEHFRYSRNTSKEILAISLPLVFQYVISVTTWLIFFLLIESKGIQAKSISNVIRNVYGIVGVFIWSFSSTCNTMVSNLLGQGLEDKVLFTVKKISYWVIGLCAFMCFWLNIFPEFFFKMFAQDASFVQASIPVVRVVSLGIMLMSIANVWLNAVTGTGETKVNLRIEIIAIILYLIYTWIFMKVHYISLAVAWSNEFIYWSSIFLMAFYYMKKGKWKKGKSTVTSI